LADLEATFCDNFIRGRKAGDNREFGNRGGIDVSGSLWVSWKNWILGNVENEGFGTFPLHILKCPPDPTASHALRTRCARADMTPIVIHGNGVPDLVGDCLAVRLGNLDPFGRNPHTCPPDPSIGGGRDRDQIRVHTGDSGHAGYTGDRIWMEVGRNRANMPQAGIGDELTHPFLLENSTR
jgi:hypothetical protein